MRPMCVKIGTFQALKHRASIMFVEIELSKSVVLEALTAIDALSEVTTRSNVIRIETDL